MGVNFVIVVENLAGRSQKEVDEYFNIMGRDDDYSHKWKVFKFSGKSYAEWLYPPRFFVIEDNPEWWEALRKYLVRVREFFGGGKVFLTNDVVWCGYPREDEGRPGYYFPCELPEDYLKEPNYEDYPELKEIKELEGIWW